VREEQVEDYNDTKSNASICGLLPADKVPDACDDQRRRN
jgi:hypothetical protein